MYMTIKEDSVYEKKKIIFGLLFLLLAVMMLMPVSIQAAAKPERLSCQASKPLIIIKLISSGRRLPVRQITSYTTRKPEPASGRRSRHLTIKRQVILTLLHLNIQLWLVKSIHIRLKRIIRPRKSWEL